MEPTATHVHDDAIAQMSRRMDELGSSEPLALARDGDELGLGLGLGLQTPGSIRLDPFSAARSLTSVEEDDDMWNRLVRIREIQNEIAAMHFQMEGLGGGERTARVMGSTDDVEPVLSEEEKKAEKNAKFEQLADRFPERKKAINGVMSKLDDLSKLVTSFHSLQSLAPYTRGEEQELVLD